ncbi:MAG: HPr family phosphocarrier protein, partial [Candidatus Omnitrophica bacterium]|nr:HPr family phosphocarrier protein [Candidatus Omnitrophota bacterium]
MNKKHYRISPTKRYFSRRYLHKISWGNSFLAGFGFFALGLTLSGLSADAAAALTFSAAVFAVQALDLKVGVIAWMNELFGKIIPTRAGPELIKPFKETRPAGKEELAYVQDGTLYVDAGEMATRPKLVQWLYYSHEWLHLKGMKSHVVLYAAQGTLIALAAALFTGVVLVPVTAMTFGAFMLFAFKEDIEAVDDPGVLVKSLNKKFPESEIDKKEFVDRFYDNLPRHIFADKKYAVSLLETTYEKALSVLKDPTKLSFEFQPTPGGKGDQLILAFADVRRGIDRFVADTIATEGVDLRDQNAFTVEVPYGDSVSRVVISMKDLSESGSERLEERTKSRIKAAFQGFSATPIMEYRGFSSIDDALASGDAAFIDAVGGVDIVAVVHNIIPREMQYDADQAAKFIEEKIEEFENRIKLFLVEAKEIRQVELTEDVEKEMEMLANETKKELRAETILGAKIVKSEPAMTMYFKILKRISELKKETKQKKNISALSALDVNLKVDVLRAFSEVIYSEDRFLRSISAEKVPGEKEKLVSILNKVRDENVKVLARTRDDLVEPVKMMVEEVRRRVLKQVEGEALPASIALCDVFCAFEETKKKGDGEQKIREIFDEAQNIVRRVIAELEETEIFIKEFKPAENDRPRVLFLKGSLLAADLENFVKNENVKLIVTTEAGPTTHWVLVAKDLNVPVFFAVKKAGGEISGISIEDMRKKIKVGDRVLFDGSTGSLISDPDVQMERDHEEKIRRHAAFETYYKRISQKPAVVGERTGTEGGRKMDVLVNAEQEDELVSALSEGADGTGLVRTEMWLSPDLQCLKDLRMSIAGGESGDKLMDARDELKRRLMEKIRGMIDRSNGKNITFRMFDAADDKQIGGQKQSAFGLDFYRTPLGHELLMIELEALFEVVAGDRHSNVKLLFPQVQNKKDVIEIREKWGQEAMDAVLAGLRYQAKKEEVEQTEKKWKAVPIGAMIESTEAVRNIKGILAGVDFVSIGTNDLIRDIFRRFEKEWGVENLRATIKGIFLFRQFQLPVARKMETIAKAVSDFQKETGRKIPVTICGNSASIKEYLLHMVYVSYKYDVDISPSIPFVDIAETKEFIRNFGHEGLKTVFETLGKGAQERVEEKVRGIKGRIANLPEVKKIMGEDAQKKAEKAREETVPLEIAVEKDEVELPKGPESQKDSAGTGEKMTLLIVNEKGLHLRSGAKIVRLMEECKADIAIWKAGGKDAPTVDKNAGKYIEIDGLLELLMFGEKKGTEIKLLIKGKNKEKFIKKLLELEDENSKGKPERVFVRVTSAEKDHHEIRGEFSVIIGVPDDVYIALGEGRIEEIEKASDIIITGVKTAGKAAMEKAVTMKGFKQKVDRMAKGRKAIAAFLDIDKEQIEEAEAIIKDFADKAAWDILKLTYPWMSSLSGETRRRLDELEKGELAGIHGVLLKTFEDMGFSDLGQKSMYEIRAENMYNRHREDYTVPLKEYLASGLNGKEARRYMVTAVDNAFDMTMLAGAIKERREMMGWTPDKEDPVMDFLIVRNEREAENIEEVLIATGLGRYLSVEQVIVVGKTDTLTPEEVMREIRKRTGKALRMKQVTMGQGADIIRIDMTNPGEIFRADNPDSPRLVQLEKGLA